jgi:hypothetical protein
MKRNYLVLAVMLFTFLNTANAQQTDLKTAQDTLNHLLHEYYRLNVIVFQENSTIEDINHLFELFTDDFTYVHEQYGGVYSREDLYNGYKRNLENGGYNGEVVDIKVNNKIVGRKAIAVNKSFIKRENGGIATGEPQMTLFEFKGNKIFRITEYW